MDEKSKIIDRAQKFAQKGYLDKAIAEYKKVVEKGPKDATIRLRIGDLYVKIGKKDEAIKEYSEVAKIHTQKGFYLKAIAVYKQILKLDQTLMDIHLKLSDLYTKQKLIADAVAELSILVHFYEKKNKVDEAVDILKKMTAVDPQNVGIRLKLADYYKTKGFTSDALAEYSAACGSLIKEGKIDKAEKLYLGLYPDHRKEISTIEGLAEVYRFKGDNNQVLRYYRELITLYKEKGETEKQKSLYEKILEIFPFDREAMDALGRKPAAVEEPVKEVVPPDVPSKEKASEEPLISWPEISIDISQEPQIALHEQETAPSREEPLIPWSEMVETGEEVKPTEAVQEIVEEFPTESAGGVIPVEVTEPELLEEVPLVEMPEMKASEIGEELKPAPADEEKPKEIPPSDIPEITPSEEEARGKEIAEELSPEHIEVIETLPIEEEIETGTAAEGALLDQPLSDQRPVAKPGLEGLEWLIPEGASIMEVLEAPPEEKEYVDISAELGLEEALDFLTEAWAPDAKGEETFTEFKHGVEKQLSKEDSETHYNLGIAYMEMELYDDAMREFKIALKDPLFEFDCYTRLGLSLMAKGDYKDAISNFLKGLKVSARTHDEKKGLMYELGLAYEAAGNKQEALEIFKSIYEMDESFREVSSKVGKLSKGEGKDEFIPSTDDILEIELL